MTRTEAIGILQALWRYISVEEKAALDMAIKALEQEPKSPCDLCKYNPPGSGDGKPCTMCPAESEE